MLMARRGYFSLEAKVRRFMLKTTSRIDKLAEALADFTEEARIG